MTFRNFHKSRFSIGEYSDEALTRIGRAKTDVAAEIQENFAPSLIGKAQVRPGLEYIETTNGNSQARIIPFVRTVDDWAILELTNGQLRILVDDAIITRPSHTTTLTNGDFSDGTGWTLSATDGATATINNGRLTLNAKADGSSAYAEQSFTVTDFDVEHGFRIEITRGPVILRLGTTSNGQEVYADQYLEKGTHCLGFIPTSELGSTYYLRFTSRFRYQVRVTLADFEIGEVSIPAPWTTSELRELSFDQNADIMFLAHENWTQQQIERRGSRSWSMVSYKPNGGPMQLVTSGVKADVDGTFGNVRLTTDTDVFSDNSVGGLVQLYHDRLDAKFHLSGDDEYTDTWRVQGIRGQYNNDRRFSYQVYGSWSGTMYMLRSISGEDGDYIEYPRDGGTLTTITGNISVNHPNFDEDNNILAYHKIGFKPGTYTSGTAYVDVQYDAFSGFGWGRIVRYFGPREVGVQVEEPFNALGRATQWSVGTWGTATLWPGCVALFDNRLWFGGETQVWASALNDFSSFDDLDSSETSSFQRDLGASGHGSFARWFLPLQRLLVGTEGAIVSIRAGAFDEGLTLSNVSLKDAATVGASYVSPVKLDARGVFVHSSGKDVYVAKPADQDYEAERLTIHNEFICSLGVVELAAQREPETHVWCVREDGQVPVIMYEFEGQDDTQCWWRFITDGSVESVCVVPGDLEDRVYMVVNRSPTENTEPETGAEILAPNSGDAFAVDFQDASVYVVDSATPANNRNEAGTTEVTTTTFTGTLGNILGPGEIRRIIGPDALISNNHEDLKLQLQADGFLDYQEHNLAPSDSAWELSGFTKNEVTIDNTPSGLIQAPDGTYSVRNIVMSQNSGNGIHWARFDFESAGNHVTTRTAQWFEISGYCYYNPSDPSNMRYWSLCFVGEENETSSVEPARGMEICFDLLTPTHLDGNLDTKFGLEYNSDIQFFDQTNWPYWTYFRHHFYTRSDELIRRVYIAPTPDGLGVYNTQGDGVVGLRLWGLNLRALPGEPGATGLETNLQQIAPTIRHERNKPCILLPYRWDADGVAQGARYEEGTRNYLSHTEDYYAASPWIQDVFVDYTSHNFSDPVGGLNASRLAEDYPFGFDELASATRVRKFYQEFSGPSGQWVGSTFFQPSDYATVALKIQDKDGNSYTVNYNVETKEVDVESPDGATDVEAGVEEFPFGWCRAWLTANLTVNPPAAIMSSSSATTTWGAFTDYPFAMVGAATTSWAGQDSTPVGDFTIAGAAATVWDNATPAAPAPLFTNISFEDDSPTQNPQDITGWTPSDPSDRWELWALSQTGYYPRGCEGNNRAFSHRDSGVGEFWLEQIGNVVAAGYTAAQIDNGDVYFQASGALGRDISTPASRGRVLIEFLDSGQSVISTGNDSGYITPPGSSTGWSTWEMENTQLPSGTRYIRWRCYAEINNTGTYNHIAFDGHEYQLTGNPSEFEIFKNTSFEVGAPATTSNTSTTTAVPFYGWTRQQGTNTSYFYGTVDSLSAHSGTRWIQGSNQATTEYRQDIDLTTEHNMISTSDIDAGKCSMSVSVQMANTFTTDTGQVIFDFRDSGGTVISTAYDTGANEITPLATWQEFSSADIAVPANTRIISVRLIAVRLLGSFANTNFDSVSARITVETDSAFEITGSATSSFAGEFFSGNATLTSDGDAATTWATEEIHTATWGATGAATTEFANAFNYISSWVATDNATTSWAITPMVWSAPGASTGAFSPTKSVGTMTAAGEATWRSTDGLFWRSEVLQEYNAFNIILTSGSNPDFDANNEPLSIGTAVGRARKGITVWGSQLEYGRTRPSSFRRSQFKSTRDADDYKFDLDQIAWNDAANVMFSEYRRDEPRGGSTLTVANGIDAHTHEVDNSTVPTYQVIDGGNQEAYLQDSVALEDTLIRMASTASTNDARLTVDSADVVQDASVIMPTVVGGEVRVGDGFDGDITRLKILPYSLDDEALKLCGFAEEQVYRYIEKLALRSEAVGGTVNKMADSGLYFAGPVSSVTLGHLLEKNNIVAWGTDANGNTGPITGLSSDTAGVVDLGGTYTDLWIGLAYTARYKSAKLAYIDVGGTSLLQRKRVAELGLLLEDTHRDAISYGGDFDRMRKMPRISRGKPQADNTIYDVYDDVTFSFPGGWDTDSRVCIEVEAPYPATLLGLIYAMQQNSK